MPWREDGVPVAARVHEVVRDEPDGVGRPDRRARRRCPCGVFHIPVTTGVVPLQLNVTFEPGDLREPAGAAGEAGSQNGVNPFTNAGGAGRRSA